MSVCLCCESETADMELLSWSQILRKCLCGTQLQIKLAHVYCAMCSREIGGVRTTRGSMFALYRQAM